MSMKPNVPMIPKTIKSSNNLGNSSSTGPIHDEPEDARNRIDNKEAFKEFQRNAETFGIPQPAKYESDEIGEQREEIDAKLPEVQKKSAAEKEIPKVKIGFRNALLQAPGKPLAIPGKVGQPLLVISRRRLFPALGNAAESREKFPRKPTLTIPAVVVKKELVGKPEIPTKQLRKNDNFKNSTIQSNNSKNSTLTEWQERYHSRDEIPTINVSDSKNFTSSLLSEWSDSQNSLSEWQERYPRQHLRQFPTTTECDSYAYFLSKQRLYLAGALAIALGVLLLIWLTCASCAQCCGCVECWRFLTCGIIDYIRDTSRRRMSLIELDGMREAKKIQEKRRRMIQLEAQAEN